jgi:murein L,D-transpeptidase YcbB/YkuD
VSAADRQIVLKTFLDARHLPGRASLALIALAGSLLLVPPAQAQQSQQHLAAAIRSAGGGSRAIRSFYAERAGAPLWLQGGRIGPAADRLIRLIESAPLDGLKANDYRPRQLIDALERAETGNPKAIARAEIALTRSFLALARDMQLPPHDLDIVYPDASMRPVVSTERALLYAAAASPALDGYIQRIGWMNPLYAELRNTATATALSDAPDGQFDTALVRLNLSRLRALPADLGKRFVLVDAAAARLYMYQDGRVRDTMRVVVGKPSEPTPMMAARIQFASLNPYWNLPTDLARLRVAAGVLQQGASFVTAKRFEIMSDWSDTAHRIDPKDVDWNAVATGRTEIRVRQLPGPNNAMGRMKFTFPNDRGIYLHDTPEKNLLRESERLFSSGCVRLEDAPRLGRWLFGRPLRPSTKPEQRVDLPEAVPVYITYLTVAADKSELVYRPDVYGRDAREYDQGRRSQAELRSGLS